MPSSQIWWRLPKGRFSSKDPRPQVRGERRRQVAFRRGTLSPGPPAPHPCSGEARGAAPHAVSDSTSGAGGGGARGGIAVTRDCPWRFGQPSSAGQRAAGERSGADSEAGRFGAQRPFPRHALLQGPSLPLAAPASPSRGAGSRCLDPGFSWRADSQQQRNRLMAVKCGADGLCFPPGVKVGEGAPYH